MTRRPTRWLRTTAVLAGICAPFLGTSAAWAQGQTAYVLTTSNNLLTINTAVPNQTVNSVPISGVATGETLVGLDIRPQNGMLYALGVNAVADTMSLYVLSPRTGFAGLIGTGGFVGAGNLPDPAVARYGLDFNPVVDRLRVTTNQSGAGPAIPGLNFRLNPNTGTFTLADTDINPAPISIDEIAYTNNTRAPSVTTLYTISSAQDAIYIQNPPNSGTQTAAIALSSPVTAVHGFDLDTTVNAAANNAPAAGSAFAIVTTASGTGLTRINLATGAVSPIATLPGALNNVRGFAVHNAAVANDYPAFVVSSTGSVLFRFNTTTPGTGEALPVTNVTAGDTLVGIDFRPGTGQLFGLGYNSVANTVQLYLIDPCFGSCTNAAQASTVGTPLALTLAGATSFGFDFNPTVDRIRVVSNAGENFRINPNTGLLAGLDAAINPAGAVVTGAAYTNNFPQTLIGGSTTLYTLDPTNNRLAIQNLPNAGTQTQLLPVTLGGFPLDFTIGAGFDIAPNIFTSSSSALATGKGFASLTVGGVTSLYGIELSTGVATNFGGISPSPSTLVSGLAVGAAPRIPTTMTLTSGQNPSVAGTAVTFTATVTPAATGGTVAFTRSGFPIPACDARPVVAGVATCTETFDTAGTYGIFALYTGNDVFDETHTFTTLSQNVNFTLTTTTLTATPSHVGLGESVTLVATVTPSAAVGDMTFTIDGVPAGTVALAGGMASLTLSNLTVGAHQVVATYGGSGQHAGSTSAAPVVATVGQFRQHFAEGATGFFHTDIGILNASPTKNANVTVQVFPEGLAAVTLNLTLNPLARQTLDLNATLEALGISASFSTLVESDQPLAATRQMTWGTPVYGSTLESGVPDTGTTWYFAEGATNVFSLFYLIENPSTTTAAAVTFTHLLEGGGAPVVQNESVPPQSRRTYFINDVPGLSSAALSTVITSSVPIVAERAMYLNTTSRLWEGGHASAGATALATTWSLAEGATGFFHTYLLLGNPNSGPATASVVYQLPDGTTINRSYAVDAMSRRTIDVAGEDPLLASATIGMTVTSTLPIVTERAMWWGEPFYEGSVAFGSTATGSVWAIGEGNEGGPADESTFVLVSNATATAGTVRLTVVYDDGTQQQKEFGLPGTSRLTVRILTDFPDAAGRRFSVLVEGLTTGVPITVEYARYQSTDGFLGAGGAALATRIR